MTVFPFLSAAVGGYILMSVLGNQVLITWFSSIPLAKRRARKSPDFDLKKAKRRISLILIVGNLIMTVTTVLMLILAPTPSTSGYLFGLILALLRSIGRMSPSDRRNQDSFNRLFADCYPAPDLDATVDLRQVSEAVEHSKDLFS